MRVDPLFQLGLTGALNDMTARENALSRQLSSGLRVASPSDDAPAASSSVRLGGQVAADDAYSHASASVESRLQVADSVLGNVVAQITSAIALAVKGSNGTLNASNIKAIGEQLAGLRDQVVTLANTSYAGSYLFSGTATATQPFTLDKAASPATVTYAGDALTQQMVTPGGQSIALSVAGSAVFSAAGADVLGSLNRLVAGLASGTPPATQEQDLEKLRAALANVSTQRATLGASLNTLQQTSAYAGDEATSLRAAQSALVATDTAQVATELSATETQQKALLSVMSLIGKANLFDYMR